MNVTRLLDRTKLTAIIVLAASVLGFVGFLGSPSGTPVAYANTNCTNATATSPTWNPFPLNFNDPNPQPNGSCTDIPLLSHWPIREGNPRTRQYVAGETVTLHLYYNNGGRQDANNPNANLMSNPRARIQLEQISPTQYRARAFLSGSGGNLNSSEARAGGDVIIDVAPGTVLEPIRRNTLWYPQAAQRLEQFNQDGRTPVSLNIDANAASENPLLSANGYLIYTPIQSNIAQQETAGLRAGFSQAGYFLTSWRVVPAQQQQNRPPVVPGQEITIIRGESGQFQPVNGTDPDNDLPLTYQPNNLPPFCTWNPTDRIIRCQTNQQTPVRSEFTVTPTDSRGLVGTPGTFIVNVIEPGLNITKQCVRLGTSNPCSSGVLRPGDAVTYTLRIRNTGNAPARNVIVNDDYDQSLLTNIRDINPQGTINTQQGTIRWELGTLNPNEERVITYNATIVQTAQNGATVTNTATVRADNIPERRATVSFTVGTEIPLLSTSDKVCLRTGTNTPCNASPLSIGSRVTYFINVRNTGTGTANNVVVVDTYDRQRLTSIGNINPQGTHNQEAGTIRWELGNIPAGQSRTLSFEATVSSTARNGDIIINTARITADNLPPRDVRVEFPVGVPVTPDVPRSGGVAAALTILTIIGAGAGYYYYLKSKNKFGHAFEPARSTEAVVDTGSRRAKAKKTGIKKN